MDRQRAEEPLDGDAREAHAGISGDLSEVALVDLVQTLEAGRRTGTVRLTDGAGRGATVWFRDGRVADCELGAARGELAFYRLLRWSRGEFAVQFEPVAVPARISASPQTLILEGLRRADEWRRLAEQLPDAGAVVEIDYRLLSERLAEIPDDVNGLLRLIDGRRTLGQVLEEAGTDDLPAAAMMARLFVEEIVRLAPPRPSAPAAAPDATPEPERVTWFSGPSEAPPSAAPGRQPAAAPPPAEHETPPPTPVPGRAPPAAPDPHAPRIVRFPPRERGTAPTPRPGAVAAVPGAARREESPARPAARAAPRRGGGRRPLAAALALLALVAGAAAATRWRSLLPRARYEAQLGEARRDREAGRLAEAIAGYRRALGTLDTSAGEAELGRALRDAAEPALAIEALRRAVELDAGNADAYIALGEVCLGERRVADARWAFERYLALEPQGGRAGDVRAALERIK